jgi:phthiocerol/phenolphthiocerol synthesis type-I polyketide synthase E
MRDLPTDTGGLKRAPRPDMDVPYEAPAGNLEVAVARILADALGIWPVGRNDEFLELGGDSLTAARVAASISVALGVRLPISLFFELATVRLLAEECSRHGFSKVIGVDA